MRYFIRRGDNRYAAITLDQLQIVKGPQYENLADPTVPFVLIDVGGSNGRIIDRLQKRITLTDTLKIMPPGITFRKRIIKLRSTIVIPIVDRSVNAIAGVVGLVAERRQWRTVSLVRKPDLRNITVTGCIIVSCTLVVAEHIVQRHPPIRRQVQIDTGNKAQNGNCNCK